MNEAYLQLAKDLEELGVVQSSMFGMPVLKVGKKPICGLDNDGVNFKLKPDTDIYKMVLGIDGAHLFQPQMKNRKGPLMKQWVVLPFAHHDKYFEIAKESIKFVESETK